MRNLKRLTRSLGAQRHVAHRLTRDRELRHRIILALIAEYFLGKRHGANDAQRLYNIAADHAPRHKAGRRADKTNVASAGKQPFATSASAKRSTTL